MLGLRYKPNTTQWVSRMPDRINKKILRLKLRKKRNNLSLCIQKKNAKSILYQCLKLGIFRQVHNVALYLTNDGEISTNYIISFLKSQNKVVYLPVLSKETLVFLPLTKNLVKNRFNIMEPTVRTNAIKHPKHINIIFMPLVGFDNNNNRLGMGGGFYDKTLAFTKLSSARFNTKIYALAHNIQQVKTVYSKNYDIKPSIIFTESRAIKINRLTS